MQKLQKIAGVLVCATLSAVAALSDTRADAFNLNGAWARDASRCHSVFAKKKGKPISLASDSDAFGGGFIVEDNRIRGKIATCKIESRKQEDSVLHIIASCSTEVAFLAQTEFDIKIDDDNNITRLYPNFPDITSRYTRCTF